MASLERAVRRSWRMRGRAGALRSEHLIKHRMIEDGRSMDIKTELTVLRRTGKFVLGFRQSYLSMLRRESKVVLVAKDCPEKFRRELRMASRMTGIEVVETGLSSLELGRLLGKPFHASTIAVLDPGTSSLGKGG